MGNDVIDLLDPESDAASLHPRWDARVFNAAEQEQIDAQPDDRSLRWKYWAAKEAAYKLVRKRDQRISFSPPAFRVELAAGEAHVSYAAYRLPVRLMDADHGIHAIAREESDAEAAILAGHERLGRVHDAGEPGRAVRRLAVTRIAQALGADPDEFEVRRERRIPQLWRANRPSGFDLSLSHHGELVGFACATRDGCFASSEPTSGAR